MAPLMPWVRWPGKTTLSTFSTTVLCMVAAIVVLLATPAIAASCQAKESCSVGQDCSICAEAKSGELCTQIAFCDWHVPVSCSAASSCSWFQEASCEPKESPSSNIAALCKAGSGGLELCKNVYMCKPKAGHQLDDSARNFCESSQSEEACDGMEFCEKIQQLCEWKDDCRQCANFTTNRECVSRDFCIWDQGTIPAYPITTADIVFVVAPLVCDLYTALRLNLWIRTLSTSDRRDLLT